MKPVPAAAAAYVMLALETLEPKRDAAEYAIAIVAFVVLAPPVDWAVGPRVKPGAADETESVSYTHLTLPTKA